MQRPPSQNREVRVGIPVAAGTVLVMFLWAVCFPLIQTGLEASPPMWFAGLRALLAGVVLIVFAGLTGRPQIRGTMVWSAVALAGLTATGLGFFGMFYGGGLVSPGLATVVANTQPLLAAPLAAVALRPQYQELVDGNDLSPLQVATVGSVLAVAAYCGDTRLIDNIVLGESDGL